MSTITMFNIARDTHQHNGFLETSEQCRSHHQLIERADSVTSRCIPAGPEGSST